MDWRFARESKYFPDDQVVKQLERMFGADAKRVLTFSARRWGEQVLTSGNGGGEGGGHHEMGDEKLRIPFVSSTGMIPGTVHSVRVLITSMSKSIPWYTSAEGAQFALHVSVYV